ncbi:MAG: DMT family transporter [Rhodospirillaceae bacterium]|nr:MAG: DMT family transporter [Rhodospirillaceae bacterium]
MVASLSAGRQILTTNSMTLSRRQYWTGLCLVLLACASLSIISTFAKLAYESGATPTTLVWMRFVSFAVVIGAYHLIRQRRLRLTTRQLGGAGIMAIGMLMNSIGYLGSVAYITVGLQVVLFYTFPIITMLLSLAIRSEKPSWTKIVCMFTAFGGVVLASSQSIGSAFDWRGVGLVLTGATGLAIAVVSGNRAMRGASPLTMNLWMNVWMALIFSGMIALPGIGSLLGDFVLPVGGLAWFGAIAASACYILGFSTFFIAVQLLPPSQTGITMNLEPFIATTSAMVILHEPTHPTQWIGMSVILAALGLSSVLGAGRHRD